MAEKNLPAVQETRIPSLGREDPLEEEQQPIAVFLPGKSRGQRTLAGDSPWGCRVRHDRATGTRTARPTFRPGGT